MNNDEKDFLHEYPLVDDILTVKLLKSVYRLKDDSLITTGLSQGMFDTQNTFFSHKRIEKKQLQTRHICKRYRTYQYCV